MMLIRSKLAFKTSTEYQLNFHKAKFTNLSWKNNKIIMVYLDKSGRCIGRPNSEIQTNVNWLKYLKRVTSHNTTTV